VVVLGPLRGRNPIHMFASASRVQRSGLRRRRSGSGSSVITRTRTGTGTFLDRGEGDNVCEAVQRRSLGLSLSSGRGLERTHTFDGSHRRTCCHQYTRIIILICVSNFLCYLGYYYILYYTHGPPPTMRQADATVLYLMYQSPMMSCRPLHQTNHDNAYSSGPSLIRRSAGVWTTKSPSTNTEI
jgi:hypothetical protein